MQWAQRVWNLHPSGGFAGDGIDPSSTIRFIFASGSGIGNCREQGFRVRMQRITENILCRSVLYQIAQIHNAYGIRNIFDYRQVMGDEQIGQAVFFLQLL